MTKKKHGSSIQKRLIPTYIFLIIVSFISVFPFYWMISAATNNTVDVARGRLAFGTYALTNLQNLLAGQDLWGALWNSFKYADNRSIVCMFTCRIWI